MTEANEKYNGWKNWSTWNVSLWLGNDEGLYLMMVEYANRRAVSSRTGKAIVPTYSGFIRWAGLVGDRTPDGAKYDAKCLDYPRLSELVRENIQSA